MSDKHFQNDRPLSPHLTIYKLIPTMVMSIVHRMTGVALYFGTFFLVLWLIAVAMGPDAFEQIDFILHSMLGQFLLFFYTWVLVHHAFGGIRHLVWDMGFGLEKKSATRMAFLTILGSVVVTILIWVI